MCESLGPLKATEGEAVEAHNQVAGLREENERLRGESQSASDSAFYHKSISDGLQDKLDALREENTGKTEVIADLMDRLRELTEDNAELRRRALIWMEFPENKPPCSGPGALYLTEDREGRVRAGFYWPTDGEPDWMLDGCDMIRLPYQPTVIRFAEIPKPEGE
jgi:hypothetical protein